MPNTAKASRPALLSRRRLLGFTVGLVALLALAIPVAWATDTFSDVPFANPHHDAINAIYGARITGGCAPGLYCPANDVRRDEMASFLNRGLSRLARQPVFSSLPPGANDLIMASASFSVGGSPSGQQGIVVRVALQADFDSALAASCTPNIALRQFGGVVDTWDIEINSSFTPNETNVNATFVSNQASSTTVVYEIIGDNPCSATLFADEGMMTVENFVFDGDGTSVSGAAPAGDEPHDG